MILLLASANAVLALDPQPSFDHYSFRQWTRDDGVPQNSVQALLQDGTGYIWLATQEGLARFDGVRFVTFDRHSSPALPANNVLSLALGRHNVIWAGLRNGGLVRLDAGRDIDRFGAESGVPNPSVRSVLIDHAGTVWVGTRGGGLAFCTAGTSPLKFQTVPALADTRVLDLFEDRDGALWIATEGDGLFRMRGSTLDHFRARDGLGTNTVWRVLQTRDGALWAATYGGGLARLKGNRFVTLTKSDGLPGNRVTCLLEDHDGNLWAGLAGAGLARIRNGRVTAVATKDPLRRATVLSLKEDREHNLWVGTESQGLIQLGDSLFTTLNGDDGLASPMARCVLEAHDGSLWVGTSSGSLQHFVRKGERLQLAAIQPKIPATDVFSLVEEPVGVLWVGTYQRGVFRLDHGRIRRWTSRDGLPADTVWALEGDGAGGVWAGTYGGGLAHITSQGVQAYGAAEGLTSKLVRVIRHSRNGDLWIGTSGGGVCVLHDGRIISNPGTGRIAHTTVMDIYEDADGNLWFGTNGEGLCRLSNSGSFGCVSMTHGLLDDVAFRILEDARDRFWMSCNHGIYRVKRADLNAVLDGKRTNVRCQVFGRPDGMPTGECNGGSQPSGWRAHSGQLWFPTPHGLVAVDADVAPSDAPPAAVVTESLRVDGQTVPLKPFPVLPVGTRSIEIDYTALTFRAPEKVHFQYRLSGLGENWIDVGARRTAYFNHLAPGTYTFSVRARNSLGRWSMPSSPLTFRIEPYFYQRLPVQLAAVFLLLLGVTALAALRSHEHRRREAELQENVRIATLQLRKAHEALEKANVKLEELSLHDPLTGIPNRRSFDQTLALLWQQSLRTSTPLSFLMIDIDRFKDYNDHAGHLAGDACLRQVATILRKTLRRAGDIVARYGGEEFAVLLPGNGTGSACQLAEELRAAVEAAGIVHPTSEHGGVLTISIGVAATVARPDAGPEDLIAAADSALYLAKAKGRNRFECPSATPL